MVTGSYRSDNFAPGDTVRVVEGIFAEMEGRGLGEEEARQPGTRLPMPTAYEKQHLVLMKIFGREAHVEFLARQLAPA
jgi:transcription antitermination factor NusG